MGLCKVVQFLAGFMAGYNFNEKFSECLILDHVWCTDIVHCSENHVHILKLPFPTVFSTKQQWSMSFLSQVSGPQGGY